MGWTSKMSRNRYPNGINSNGKFIGEQFRAGGEIKKPVESSNDTNNRHKIIEEIQKRCEQGEVLDAIVSEIASREDVKKQFEYFAKNGITDLSSIFKSWYESYLRNLEKNYNFSLNEIR